MSDVSESRSDIPRVSSCADFPYLAVSDHLSKYLIYKSLFTEYPKLHLDYIKKFVYYFVIFQGGEHYAHHQIQCRSPQRL